MGVMSDPFEAPSRPTTTLDGESYRHQITRLGHDVPPYHCFDLLDR